MNERDAETDEATATTDVDDEQTAAAEGDEQTAAAEGDEQTAAAEGDEPTAETEDGENGDQSDEAAASDTTSLGVGVVTIATDRAIGNDIAGETIITALKKESHEIVVREHLETEHDQVQSTVSRLLDRDDIDLIVTGGATSVEPDDITIEAVEPLLEKELSAFSELFTALAYEEVGTRIIAARTLAGVADGIPVFCLPGNEAAVRLGLEEIILPEAHHLIGLARGPDDEDEPSAEPEGDEPEAEEAETDAGESDSTDDERNTDRDDNETEAENGGE
ncbi:MogA/MoaB family molybdenum cofactor biosynthesis protein [Natronorubrum thiooxidans]|uniref:Molybdenum cofactor synthesis domain-containing protein n=1 Tax=Natronorubrum thiooxidans TaxID=308853 RepID=A0A1N7DQP0_9EURY|nr:molybdopterin-binding protein [Natronorubrum thiooxidans]SIR78005.1 molybdenum cofactor synthesis domain-containing protein [Natronorubrum thiooxidans]